MDVQLNNNVFDQLTSSRDYIREKAALAARIANPSDQSFGLGWLGPCPDENGERTRKAALARSFIHFVKERAATFMESQTEKSLPASKHSLGQKEPLPARGVAAENMEITYRVALSLMESEQITLARKTLDSLPVSYLSDPMIVRLRKMLAVPITKTSQKRDIDRALDYQWIRDHAQDYRGQWVALDNGELLGAATSLRELLDRVKPLRSEHRPLLHQIS